MHQTLGISQGIKLLTIALFLGLTSETCFAQIPQIEIADGGVLNGASYLVGEPLAPGAIFTILGSSLTDGSHDSAHTLLPRQLAGARVLVNGIVAPLFFASPEKIKAQFPIELEGVSSAEVQVQVQRSDAIVTSRPVTVPVAAFSPGIFTLDDNGTGPGIITTRNRLRLCPQGRTDCSVYTASPGEIVTIYGTGLGRVSGLWATGLATSEGHSTLTMADVIIGGLRAEVLYAGTVAGNIGLYQVNAVVPANAPGGNSIPVTLTIGGIGSNAATMPISPLPPLPFIDLAIGITADPNPVPAGGKLTYNIRVGNLGNAVAHEVTVTDRLDFYTSFSSCNASAGNCSEDRGTITESLGSLEAGASATVAITAIARFVTSPSVIRNEADVSTADSDINGENNSAEISVDLFPVGAITQGGGPPGTHIVALVVDPRKSSTLYAGADFGLFKSTNGGASWSTGSFGPISITIPGGTTTTTSTGSGYVSVDALAIAPDSSALYAVTYLGVFKSGDAGATWKNVLAGSTAPLLISSLAVDPLNPSIVYAGGEGGSYDCSNRSASVYKSTDAGATWTPYNNGLPYHSVTALAIDPANPRNLYAGTSGIIGTCGNTSGGGVFKSTNGGGTWTATSGLDGTGVRTIVIDPANPAVLYAGTDGTGTTGGISTGSTSSFGGGDIFKSTDGGATWVPLNSGRVTPFAFALEVLTLVVNPLNSAVVYAGTNFGVLKSITGGASWTFVNTGLTNTLGLTLAMDLSNPSTLYAGTYGGVFKTVDDGLVWNPSNYGFSNATVQALAVNAADPATVFAGTADSGLFKSANGGLNWTGSGSGLRGASIQDIAFDPSNHSVIYAVSSGVYKSGNAGASWEYIGSGIRDSVFRLVVDPFNSSVLYAGTFSSGVFKTTNGGVSWNRVNSGLPTYTYRFDSGVFTFTTGITTLAIDPKDSSVVYAGTSDGVFKSTDSGSNWTAVNSGLPAGDPKGPELSGVSVAVWTVAVDPAKSSTLYAGTANGGIFKSVNGGASWIGASSGIPPIFGPGVFPSVWAVVIDPRNPSNIYAGTDLGVFKSANGGATWISSGLVNAQIWTLAIDPKNTSTLYAGTGYYGVLKSTDGAASWQPTGSN